MLVKMLLNGLRTSGVIGVKKGGAGPHSGEVPVGAAGNCRFIKSNGFRRNWRGQDGEENSLRSRQGSFPSKDRLVGGDGLASSAKCGSQDVADEQTGRRV